MNNSYFISMIAALSGYKGLFGCDLTLGCLATDLGGGVYKLRFVSGPHQISRAEAPTNEFNPILFGGHLQPSRP